MGAINKATSEPEFRYASLREIYPRPIIDLIKATYSVYSIHLMVYGRDATSIRLLRMPL